MKLGFISSILEQDSYEEMMDTAAELGFECVEVACWPKGKAERRYAGVSHIDGERVLEDDAYAKHIIEYAEERNIKISSLGYYPNTLDPDENKRALAIEHLKNLIRASKKLEIVKEVWPSILKVAEENQVRVAIENCPMLFGEDQWPGGQNLMTTPVIWEKVFSILDSEYLGINYDPSHFVWQMMDYIKPIYQFKDKIFHVHYKDIKVYQDKLEKYGSMAYPLQYMSPKLPGLGDVDWGKYVSALTDIGYEGYTCIEIEDKAFEGSRERVIDSLKLTKKYLKQFVI